MSTAGKIAYVVLVAGVFAGAVLFLRGDNPPPTGTIRITARLDEYTRTTNPTVPNTIPAFLTLPGNVGIVPPDASAAGTDTPAVPVESVTPVNDAELKKGFCTASTTVLIRQQYPGVYDDVPDAELIKSVLKQHPEYKDRICILPVWINATPHEIVKYELTSSSPFALPPRVLYIASGITLAFAIALGVLISKLSG